MKNIKKYIPFIYIFFLILSFLYVRSVLKVDTIDIIEEDKEKKAVEIKPVKVNLTIQSSSINKTYSARMENQDSVFDLLDYLRKEEGLYFETTDYTYGTEIEDVLNLNTSNSKEWRLYKEEEDITYKIKDTDLEDNTTYYLRLED